MSPLRLRPRESDGFVLAPRGSEAKLLARQRMTDCQEVDGQRRSQHRRKHHHRGSSSSAREQLSIHLDSAPWLGFDRASHAAPRGSKDHLRQQISEFENSRHHASATANGSSGSQLQPSLHSTASATDSMLSSSSRLLLQRKAVQISHALVRRANQMINSVERSRALAAGSRRARSMDIEGYRFLHVSKSGVAVYEDATSIRLEPRASAQPRYIGIAAVKATLDEFVDTFGHESELGFSHLNPDVTSCRQMHAISAEPDCRVGVKWLAWTGALARRRDFVVLDCEEVFSTDNGSRNGGTTRRGWVHSMHSVQLPWCPPMEAAAASVVRASMYQTGTVVLEAEASSEWLHVVSIVEMDMKGSMPERTQRATALRRVGSLESVAPTLAARRIQRMSMLRTKQFNAAKPPKDAHCAVCTQRLGLTSLRLHHYCRKCAATVCSGCSRNWQLDPASKKKTRICRLCVVATRPSKVFTSSWIESVVDSRDASSSSAYRYSRQGDEHRASRAQTLPEGRSRHGNAPNPPPAPQNPSRANSVPTSRRRASRRYFDLPMDASELGPVSDDEDANGSDESDCTSERIYPFGDAGALLASEDSAAKAASEALTWCDLVPATRISQTVTEDEDEADEVDDNELGYSVGPGVFSAAAVGDAGNPNRVYMRDDEIHL